MDQALGARQPVPQYFEESAIADLSRRIQIARKRPRGPLVNLQEQSVLAAEMLENGSLGNIQCRGQVTDARRVIAVFGEMAHGGVHNLVSLAFRTWTRRHI